MKKKNNLNKNFNKIHHRDENGEEYNIVGDNKVSDINEEILYDESEKFYVCKNIKRDKIKF